MNNHKRKAKKLKLKKKEEEILMLDKRNKKIQRKVNKYNSSKK